MLLSAFKHRSRAGYRMNRPLIMHAEPVAMCCSSFLHPWLPKLSDMCTTSPAGMLETKVPKFSWSSGEADQEIPTEVWSTVIVATLSLAEIVGMRAVSKAFCVHMTDDDLWMNKMTSLVLRYPVLMHVHQRMGERIYEWFARSYMRAADAVVLARRHKENLHPFLKLYGHVNGTTFTPFSDLQFPVPRGLIADLDRCERHVYCAPRSIWPHICGHLSYE